MLGGSLYFVEALRINPKDTVLSITSGGDNTLALLLAHPQNLIALYSNPAQNCVLKLKLAAARTLDYDEYLELLGVNKSSRRVMLFDRVRHLLDSETVTWWDPIKKI